jgi:mRNA-degrading endonuclease RelE of RelBE toxin-antitoxin system
VFLKKFHREVEEVEKGRKRAFPKTRLVLEKPQKIGYFLKTSSTSSTLRLKILQFRLFIKDLKVNALALYKYTVELLRVHV